MKKININGQAQTESAYRVALVNKYDSKTPLNTVLVLDPSRRSFDFSINYDLGEPSLMSLH